MTDVTVELRELRLEDKGAFMDAMGDFARERPPWSFALGWEASADFADYVAKLANWSRGVDLPAGFVPNTFYVAVDGGTVVGRVSLRHRLNDFLRRIGGHVGYGVRPGCRRRGYATAMLRQALPIAAAKGIARVLITCDVDNVGSRKVIERCGGVFESETNDPDLAVQKRRYWIETGTGRRRAIP